MVLEGAFGRDLPTVVEEEVLRPLGLEDAAGRIGTRDPGRARTSQSKRSYGGNGRPASRQPAYIAAANSVVRLAPATAPARMRCFTPLR